MSNIEVIHAIDDNRLNKRYYFKSLIEYAYCAGILSNKDIMRLQSELLSLLAEQTERYTNGKSSSVPKEKAQELSESVIFTIGLYLKSCDCADDAVKALQSLSVKHLFSGGLEVITTKMVIAHRLQKKIAANLLKTPNVYYRATVIDGINGFFKLYTPQFSAHEIHITADYPTLADRPRLDGIEFIESYLRSIEAENLFCKIFDESDIDRLMRCVSEGYENCPVNIFEPVLLSSVGLIMAGKYPKFLDLTASDVKKISDVFANKQKNEISDILTKFIGELIKTEQIPSRSIDYIRKCIPKLTAIIKNAEKINAFNRIFIPTAYFR